MMKAVQTAIARCFVASKNEQNILLLVVTRYAYDISLRLWFQIFLPPASFFIVVNYLERSVLKIDTDFTVLVLVEKHTDYAICGFEVEDDRSVKYILVALTPVE